MEGENEQIIDEICTYAKDYQIKEMLQEYLRRIILAKPKDPVKFLLQTIQDKPFLIPETPTSEE